MKKKSFDRLGFLMVMAYFLALGWHIVNLAVFPTPRVDLPPGLLAVEDDEGIDLAMAKASRVLDRRHDLRPAQRG